MRMYTYRKKICIFTCTYAQLCTETHLASTAVLVMGVYVADAAVLSKP